MSKRNGNYTRRDAIQLGTVGALGLTLGDFLRRRASGNEQTAKAESAIIVWLDGGPPHMDTFDMKPDAPDEVRGEFKPIKTNVSGIQICEHLPRLARCADKYAILQGVSHTLAGHQQGTSYLATGNRPLPSLVYPGYGAVVHKELRGHEELPHFVAIPNTPQSAGYLGVQHAALATNDVPRVGKPFDVRGITLQSGATVDQFQKRQSLLKKVDTAFGELAERDDLVVGLDEFDRQAYAMISSPRAREAFDTGREPENVSSAFGDDRFGQSCLLAVRLIEAGVRFTTVNFSGWDTHSGNFKKCQESLLPQLDQGLSALLDQLEARGLLQSTTVMVLGEFGRTPKINPRAGRDHWPRAFSVLMAGGGVRGGQVIGASDEKGMGPANEPITPDQVAASFYHSLGINHQKEYQTNTGRPVMIVRHGNVIDGLFG